MSMNKRAQNQVGTKTKKARVMRASSDLIASLNDNVDASAGPHDAPAAPA
jgi:hypothetical protein